MSNLINFGMGDNFYHLIKESNVKQEAGMIAGEAHITGYTKQEILEGDELSINGTKYSVVSVSRRNHTGVFKNPKDSINTFFECNCTFTRTK